MSKARIAVIGSVLSVGAVLLAPGPASARLLHFSGTAKADALTKVTFDVKGFTKEVKLKNGKTRKRFVATQVSNVHVIDQLFTCYTAAGNPVMSGRFSLQYQFYNIPPMKVKNRKFSGTHQYEPPPESNPITRETFAGRFTGRRATGTFRAQYDPGGIQFGYCGNKDPEPWKARG